VCNTKWLKNGKLRRAILSAFYTISQRDFGILLILWCSFKLWWNVCLDLSRSKFCSLGNRSIDPLKRTIYLLYLYLLSSTRWHFVNENTLVKQCMYFPRAKVTLEIKSYLWITNTSKLAKMQYFELPFVRICSDVYICYIFVFRKAEQLALCIKVLRLLNTMLEFAREEIKLGRLQPSDTVKSCK
jgi:hypothetical protein